MAIGLFSSKKDGVIADAPPLVNAPETEKSGDIANGYGGQDAAYDPEKLGGQRRMSRIDKAVTKPITAHGDHVDSDDSSGISVGKQLELEAGNAIKYRTCSWPKV